jgi:hypothetical protein
VLSLIEGRGGYASGGSGKVAGAFGLAVLPALPPDEAPLETNGGWKWRTMRPSRAGSRYAWRERRKWANDSSETGHGCGG